MAESGRVCRHSACSAALPPPLCHEHGQLQEWVPLGWRGKGKESPAWLCSRRPPTKHKKKNRYNGNSVMGESSSINQAQAAVKVLWVSWTGPNYLQHSLITCYLTGGVAQSLHSRNPPEDGNLMQQWKFKLLWWVDPQQNKEGKNKVGKNPSWIRIKTV